ncbi:MAG: AMP-binding protein [Pseudomonadota bacterium]
MTTDDNDLDRALALGMGLAYHAARQPDSEAIVSHFGDRTYAELNNRTNQLVRCLRERGVGPGSAVAIVARNCSEFVEALSSATRGGFRFTPINFHLTAEEVGYIVNDCEAEAVIYDGGLGTGASALMSAPDCRVRLSMREPIEGFEDYEEALSGMCVSDIPDPQHGSAMFYTSGTTGRPKGVRRHGQPNPSSASARLTGESPNTVSLCTGPMYHGAPFATNVTTPLNAGSKLVLMDSWDAEETLRLIERHGVTHTHMVATMFHRLLQLPAETKRKYDTSSLRFVLHGATPCPVHVKHAIINWLGPIVYEYFSATEGGSIYFIDSENWLRKPGSVGTTLQPENTRILDETGSDVQSGQIGKLFFKTPSHGRFEYFKSPEKTASSYRGDWFTLGDMGYLDEEGFLYLTGRSAETIISGGVNVYPQEIDDALLQHEAVFDVCTVGVPNDEWGEEVKSVVQLATGNAQSPELARELLDHAKTLLPKFKQPRSVDFVEDLPRMSSGKVKRNAVRSTYWTSENRDI